MSTIAGVFRLDRAPASPLDVHRLLSALAHRSADITESWVDGPVGLAAGLWRTTPESMHERQPHHVPASSLSIVFDGRVDNRDQLRARLRDQAALPAGATDVDIVAAAYERWGADCAAEILGDFAFAIWDGRARRLCCSRDVLGLRPFFYRMDASRFVWASEPHALLRYDGTAPEPNEAMVGEYLTHIVDKTETLLAGVSRLPPAHTLTVDATGMRTWQYWDVDPKNEVRFADERDYIEQLDALIVEAVTAQLRSTTPVGVLLSGGLDSSTVLGVARAHGPNGAAPRAYGLAVDGVEDESAYIRKAAVHAGVHCDVTVADLSAPSPILDQIDRYLDIPQYPNAEVAMPLRARAAAAGTRVMLSGLGPDEWLRGSRHHYADQLRRGQLIALVRGMRHDARVDNFCGWRRAVRMSLWPMLQPHSQRRVARLLGRPGFSPWIGAAFAERIDLTARLSRSVPDPGFSTYAQYDMYRIGLDAWDTHAFELLDRSSAPYGIETRHPLNDRRLIEFGLALPESMRWRDGAAKYLLRRVAERYVPEPIYRRLTSPDYSRMLACALDANGGSSRFRSLRIAERGWVDGPLLARMYEDMARRRSSGDAGYAANLWSLWMVFVLELWFERAICGVFSPAG